MLPFSHSIGLSRLLEVQILLSDLLWIFFFFLPFLLRCLILFEPRLIFLVEEELISLCLQSQFSKCHKFAKKKSLYLYKPNVIILTNYKMMEGLEFGRFSWMPFICGLKDVFGPERSTMTTLI